MKAGLVRESESLSRSDSSVPHATRQFLVAKLMSRREEGFTFANEANVNAIRHAGMHDMASATSAQHAAHGRPAPHSCREGCTAASR